MESEHADVLRLQESDKTENDGRRVTEGEENEREGDNEYMCELSKWELREKYRTYNKASG